MDMMSQRLMRGAKLAGRVVSAFPLYRRQAHTPPHIAHFKVNAKLQWIDPLPLIADIKIQDNIHENP